MVFRLSIHPGPQQVYYFVLVFFCVEHVCANICLRGLARDGVVWEHLMNAGEAVEDKL